jgi:hypothetical protein
MARRGDAQSRQYSIRAKERFSEKPVVREGRDNHDVRAARHVRDALRPRAEYGGEPDSFRSAHVEDTLPQTAGSADHGHVAEQRANRAVSKWRLRFAVVVIVSSQFRKGNQIGQAVDVVGGFAQKDSRTGFDPAIRPDRAAGDAEMT